MNGADHFHCLNAPAGMLISLVSRIFIYPLLTTLLLVETIDNGFSYVNFNEALEMILLV